MCCKLKNEHVSCPNFKTQLNYENQIILLMIPNGEEWYYLAEEKIPVLLRGITLKHVGDFYG